MLTSKSRSPSELVGFGSWFLGFGLEEAAREILIDLRLGSCLTLTELGVDEDCDGGEGRCSEALVRGISESDGSVARREGSERVAHRGGCSGVRGVSDKRKSEASRVRKDKSLEPGMSDFGVGRGELGDESVGKAVL